MMIVSQLLKKFDLDTLYKGNLDVIDDECNVKILDNRPDSFKCYLDTGLMSTITAARIFGAMKAPNFGACG